jgi:hypothetical protein
VKLINSKSKKHHVGFMLHCGTGMALIKAISGLTQNAPSAVEIG